MSTITELAAFSARISAKTVWTFVRARTASGLTGWGEATLQDEAAAIHAHVDRLSPALIGQPVRTVLDVDADADKSGLGASEAAARSAIDQALWDVAAQDQGKTLADALGAVRRTTIALYANINRGTIDRSPCGFAERALEAARAGFAAIKIAPFDDVVPANVATAEGSQLIARGVERIRAVRAAIGFDTQLMVDCHWRLTEPVASEVLRSLEPARLHWFECPLQEEESMFAGLRRLRTQANGTGVLLAGCETLTGVHNFSTYLDAGVYDVIMPDVKYAGGLREILKVGDAAARAGALCSPHNPSGPIAHAHSLHVSALLSDGPFLEFQYGESPLFFEIVAGQLPDPRRGSCPLPRGPGLGIAIDMQRLQPLLVDDNRLHPPAPS